jgi:putative PIN family toxin of toxin-antitoxin system
MRRVVLDTNVVVSALLTPQGKTAKILDLLTGERLQAYYSTEILAEYLDVLSRPRFNFAAQDQASFINGMRRIGVLVEPPVSNVPFVDESDRIFYDVAKFCDAILITGNLKHYPHDSCIIRPAEFLAFFA